MFFLENAKTMALSLIVLLTLARSLTAQDTDHFKNEKQLRRKLREVLQKYDLPAVFAAVVDTDSTIATLCDGVRKRGTKSAAQLTDRIALGSNTKSMTATLAAIVVESGEIDWNTTIAEIWPNLKRESLHPNLREVSLNDLLSHRSGIRRDFASRQWGSFFDEKHPPELERRRMLKLCMKDKPPHRFGEYNYSNLGYVVAAVMLEKVTGDTYENLMQRKIFQPLGMKSAEFRTMKMAEQLKPPLMWGHRSDGSPMNPKLAGAENPSAYASAGTVHLTIADYAKYARWHLKEKPEPLLSRQSTFDHLHSAHATNKSNGTKYGCGWIQFPFGNGRALQHAGSNTNSFALIWLLPDQNLAAIAWTNTYQPKHFEACDEMIGAMLKLYGKK